MIIIDGKKKIKVPKNFFAPAYQFGMARIRRIKKKSGLSYPEFARVYGFSFAELAAWTANRQGEKTNNPCPDSRLKLAFIEVSLRHK